MAAMFDGSFVEHGQFETIFAPGTMMFGRPAQRHEAIDTARSVRERKLAAAMITFEVWAVRGRESQGTTALRAIHPACLNNRFYSRTTRFACA